MNELKIIHVSVKEQNTNSEEYTCLLHPIATCSAIIVIVILNVSMSPGPV